MSEKEERFRAIGKSISKICLVMVYLIETRDERKKGNKLAPEQVMFDMLKLCVPTERP